MTDDALLQFEITRRDLMIAGASAALFAADSALAQVGITARGRVYEILNSGDKGAGLSGVLVSNGRDVTRTGSDGSYVLPVEPGQTIFIVKPSGYAPPLDPVTRLPRFYYVHEPEGTPQALNLAYAGLAPTGPLPESLDFGLIRSAEPTRFDVVMFTDPQPETEVEIDYIRDDLVNDLIGVDAAFGLTAGDIMFDDLSQYDRLNRIFAQIGLPWWSVGGNHDLNFESPGRRRSRETFKRVFGPPYYAFAHGEALFIMLDNVEYLGPDPRGPNERGGYVGAIGAEQLAFVANLLRETPQDRLIVVVMHIPLRCYVAPDNADRNTADFTQLLDLLGDRPSVSFSGHTHTTEHHYLARAGAPEGAAPHHHHVLTAACGSWWSGPLDARGVACADSRDGTPNGFHILSVDGARYETRFFPASEPANRQMRIMIDGRAHRGKEVFRDFPPVRLLGSPLPQASAAAATLVVNVFDGGPRTRVEFKVNGADPIAMTRTERPDPYIEELYGRNPATIKPWVKPEISSHIWTSRLPAALAPGTYTIGVRAFDEYGREHKDHMTLEIVS